MAREYYDEMKQSALLHKREDLASEECADVGNTGYDEQITSLLVCLAVYSF